MSSSQVPCDKAAEEAVIGSLLIDPDAMPRVLKVGLTPVDFHQGNLARVFRAILALHERKEPADHILVVSELEQRGDLERVGGASEVIALIARCSTAIYAEHYAGVIKRCALQRAYIAASGMIANAAYAHEGTSAELHEAAARIWQATTANVEVRTPVQTYTLADILDNVGDPAPDIVAGLIPGEATIIFSGDGGIGKGYTMLDMAFRVAQGLPWLGMATRIVNVLIVDVENQEARVRQRIIEIMGGHGLEQPPENIQMAFNLHSHLDGTSFVPELTALAEWHQAGLVILDSLSDFLGDLDENSNPDMSKVAGKLRAIRNESGATIMAQHHVSKASAGKSYQTSRGASSLFDGVDVDIQVMRDGPQLTMEQKKNRLGVEMRVVARLNWGPGTFNLSPVSTKIGRPQRTGQDDKDETAILDLLESGQWWPSNELVDQVSRLTNHARTTIHGKLRLLVTDAKLERRDNGPGIPYQVRLISEQDDDQEQA